MQLTFKQTTTEIEKILNSNKSKMKFNSIQRANLDMINKPALSWNLYPVSNDLESENGYPSGFKAKLICYIEGNGSFKDIPIDDLMEIQVQSLIDVLFNSSIEFDSFSIENAILSNTDKQSKDSNHNVIVVSCECYYKCGE